MIKGAKQKTVPRSNSHGLDQQWYSLQDYLVPRMVKHQKYPGISTEAEAEEAAEKHVKAWITLGYGHDDLKKIIKKAKDKNKLNKDLWEKLTKQKMSGNISSRISASFLIDKTMDYFKKLLAAETPPKMDTHSRYRHTSRSESSVSPGPSSNNNSSKDSTTRNNNNNKPFGNNLENTSSPSKNDATKGLGGTKRKLEDSKPFMDMRKKVRLEQEERWNKERVGIEVEMDGLQAFYDTNKEESWDEFKDVIVQMTRLLAINKYSLKEIRNKLKMKDENQREVEMNRISRQVFGDTRKRQTKNVGQNDMLIYSNLLQRFCSYVSNPGLIKDDIAFKPVKVSSEFEKTEPVFIESMESIDAIVKQLDDTYERYVREQKIPGEYENLYRYLYYDESLKTVQAYVNPHKMISDFVLYLDSVISRKGLSKEIVKLRDSQNSMKKVIDELGKILEIENLPLNCKSKWGLLLKCLVEFFCHNKICLISQTANSIKMSVDKTLPEKYQKHIFKCYVEEAIQMHESGELEGFQLSFIDSENLSRAVRETVNFMIDCGFNMYEAIRLYMDGNLNGVLKKLIKPHEVVNPEGNHASLLIRLTYDFLDSTIKRELTTLPIPKKYRNQLKRRVVNLINNGQFFQAEKLDKVKIKLTVPKMEQETLEPISAFGIKEDDVINESNPEDLGGSENRFVSWNHDVNETMSEDLGEAKRSIIPGNAILTKVIVIPPRNQKNFFAYVHGLPNIKKQSWVRIKPLKEVLDHHKVEMVTQTVEGLTSMTVLVSMQNESETEVVVLPKGLVIADVEVVDKSAILEEGLLSPGYCSQVIRHFNLYEGIENIQDAEDHFNFCTENNVVPISKNKRTDLKIFGTKYVNGKEDHYRVDAVVEFLSKVKDVEADYPTYLKIAIKNGAQIIRPKDADDLHAYFHGKVGICPQIDKSLENDKDFTQKLKEVEEKDDDLWEKDLILQLEEFLSLNFEMKVPQITEEIRFFTQAIEECGHPLSSLPMDFFAVSNYRDIFKEELAAKLDEKLRERRFQTGDLQDFNHLNNISMNSLKTLPKPTKVKDMEGFLSFAEKFASEIPSLKEQIVRLYAHIQGKGAESDFGWTGNTEELFQNMKKQIASVACLKPPNAEGKIQFFCAASEDCISAVIAQEQNDPNDDKACWNPIAFNSRLLSPEETKMSKIEKQAHAVVWGIRFNKDTLSHMDFNLNVTSDQLAKMFKPGNLNTEHWYAQLEDFKFTVKQIKKSENPAVWLTQRDKNEDTRPYARATLVTCLFNETLSLLKKNGKARNKCIKMKHQKLLKFSGGSDVSGPKDAAEVRGMS